MYTTTGENISFAEFEARRAKGERLYVGTYPLKDKNNFKSYAHSHTRQETLNWLNKNQFSLDIMYDGNGYSDCYDKKQEECVGIRCTDGYLWN